MEVQAVLKRNPTPDRPEPRGGRDLPLTGIRVVSFGHYVSAPLAARLLAEQGATVTYVHRPARDNDARPARWPWHADADHVCLNVKDPSAREVALNLITAADVVIENFRPGVMERLALDASACRARNPRLVYCSIPGFARSDSRAPLRAWEGIVSAASGLCWLLSSGSRPVASDIPLASIYGALYAVLNIAAALVRRVRTGAGATIEVPLFAAMLAGMMSARIREPRGRLAPDRTASNGTPAPHATAKAAMPFNTSYRCRDGRRLYVLAPDHSRFAKDLLSSLGVTPDPALGLVDRNPWQGVSQCNIADPLFLNRDIRQHLYDTLAAVFATRPAVEWEGLLARHGVPAAVCRTRREWLAMTDACAPLTPAVVVRPRRDDHPHRDRSRAVRAPRPPEPLLPLRVVDLSTVIAGPTCGRTLAELGADVIKIDSPRPRHNAMFTCVFGIEVNRGKRSILLDVTHPLTRDAVRRLMERADVVVDNSSTSVAAECVPPDALPPIHCRLNAYGFEGAWSSRKGYDPVVQAATGIQARFGGSVSTPRVHANASTLDFATGVIAAYGVALAELQRIRRRTSLGDLDARYVVESSLTQVSFLIQADAIDEGAASESPETESRDPNGRDVFDRMYQCADGWLYVSCPDRPTDEILELHPFERLGNVPRCELAMALERLFLGESVATWQMWLAGVDVAAHPVLRRSSICETSLTSNDGLFVTLDHQGLGPVDVLAGAAFVRDVPAETLTAAPKMGINTKAILAELGFAPSEIDGLLAAGVVSESLGEEYVP